MPEATMAAQLARARSRLERQELYPRPLRGDVLVVIWPWFFRIPWYRRYVAYTLIRRIVLSAAPEELIARHGERWFESLLVHELCHVWQVQQHPIATGLAHLRYRYRNNPFEIEARSAARRSRCRVSRCGQPVRSGSRHPGREQGPSAHEIESVPART